MIKNTLIEKFVKVEVKSRLYVVIIPKRGINMPQFKRDSVKKYATETFHYAKIAVKNFFDYAAEASEAIKEYSALIAINLKVGSKSFIEYARVVCNYYYASSVFRNIDSTIVFSYLYKNPFKISKQFLLKTGADDIYTYGETPLTTLDHICSECRLSDRDTVFELGCGRGRTCFWLHEFIGCSVVGVDHVPQFIERANDVKGKFEVQGVEFRQGDLLTTSLTGATVVYLYGTCYSAAFIQQLADHLTSLPKGAKVITVSYSLNEFAPKAPFEVMRRFPAQFTWGEADVFLQIRT